MPCGSDESPDVPARFAILAGLYGSVGTGVMYGFSVYSSALKKRFDLTQEALDNINTLPYALGLLSPLVGMVTQKLGPKLSLALGACAGGAMQLLMYLLCTHFHEPLKRHGSPALILPIVTGANYLFAMSVLTSLVFSKPVQFFPRNRGQATAIVKSFVGLGGAVVTQAFVFAYGEVAAPPPSTASCCGHGPSPSPCLDLSTGGRRRTRF